MKRIVLTGGGTAGHVTPNIALLPRLKELDYDIHYIGSHNGIERRLIEEMNIPYYGISSGKLRRYFDIKNFTDPFHVLKGYIQARKLMKQLQPDIVFSKGGFVTVPVVFAAKKRKLPVLIHESDMTPGLANKLSIPYSDYICCNFPETMSHLPKGKAVLTGSPIREELLSGNKAKALELCRFTDDKPVLLVIGGSQGSAVVNEAIRDALPELLKTFQIVHLCGKDKLDESLNHIEGYQQFEYLEKDLANIFAITDVCVSRAGANAICELLALHKPNLLIPLSANASRGDQILNAESFQHQGFSEVLTEKELAPSILIPMIIKLYENQDTYITTMKASKQGNAIEKIIQLIETTIHQ